jgi:hypothetical protein
VIPGTHVSWRVVSGRGTLLEMGPSGEWHPVLTTRTGPDGLAAVSFIPGALGPGRVIATVFGRTSEPAGFTVVAAGLVIQNAAWGYFLGPNDSADVAVPVGTAVEWVNVLDDAVEVRSTSAPPGGAGFTTSLARGERPRLTPLVPGDWRWTYPYTDASGQVRWASEVHTLTAR